MFLADADEGYRWREIATLSEPGFEVDQWVGNACVTASGRRAVVVYAPRGFLNEGQLFNRGGFVAIVDFENAAVVKLSVQASLAYFSPACGAGEEAVLTQGGDEDFGRTRLLTIRADAATSDAAVAGRVEVPGQLTSPVPTEQGIVAADDGALVLVADNGSRTPVTSAHGVPFKVAADAAGGVVFLERAANDEATARRLQLPTAETAATVSNIGSGPLTNVDVLSGRGGRVFVTGTDVRGPAALPPVVGVVDLPAGSELSTEGDLAITAVEAVTIAPDEPLAEAAARPIRIAAASLRTGQEIALTATPEVVQENLQGHAAVPPADALTGEQLEPLAGPGEDGLDAGRTASPALETMAAAGRPDNPADPDERTCAITRNDPANQAMQPKPRQVEWAVDQAVTGSLTVQRPANWKNLGMPAYTPQGLFPSIPLIGGGRVPAQVMLGIAAQESNLWQAARFAVPGVTANPLIGNYYGIDLYDGDGADDWDIDFAEADCGYGVTQVTDGMRLAGRTKPGETALPYQTQRAVALDFAANIAAGLRILQSKWNELKNAGIVVNNGDPAKIENWFLAVWAYNSGFYPQSAASSNGGAWGVGWLNNPANPNYPANRLPFLDNNSYGDAAHPQDWPYPEKVMGWAAYPPQSLEAPGRFVAGFRPAYWNGDANSGPANRSRVKPPVSQFCDASNDCVPGTLNEPNDPDVVGEPAGPCAHRNTFGQFDLRCWYHQSTTWKPLCSYDCGNELLRFDPGYAYQDDATSYPPNCTLSGLPAGARIIDDLPDGSPSVRPNCDRTWTNAGTFTLNYRADANGTFPGKVDTHQIGGGFGGHFWFAHTRTPASTGGRLAVEGVWRLGVNHTGPMRVLVALPDHGAHTRTSTYTVVTAQGPRQRRLPQPGQGNRWVSLGAFQFDGTPEVRLSSVTPDGDGSEDIAFDAVAFVPVNGTPREKSVEVVSLFDENQNIDTAAPESWLGGPLASRQALHDWALQRSAAILALPPCVASQLGECLTPAVGTAMRSWRDTVIAAGTDPVSHPPGNSIGKWIGFANSYLDRPTSLNRPAAFDDDERYKIKLKVTVSFLADGGAIVPGSEWVTYDARTGDTHLPDFVTDLVRAVGTDYGSIGLYPPDLSYRSVDLNVHDGATTLVNPMLDGLLPGRAYATAGAAPALVAYDGGAGASCVRTRGVSGGSLGYRPMLGQSGPPSAMDGYRTRLEQDARIPRSVATLADGIYQMFFRAGFPPALLSSLFNAAPPIWNELTFMACVDGTVRPVPGTPVLRSSWMPDTYLYHDGLAMLPDGAPATAVGPVQRGNFMAFSSSPAPRRDTPYTRCRTDTGQTGNPWGIDIIDAADVNPSVHFCDDARTPGDSTFSSP